MREQLKSEIDDFNEWESKTIEDILVEIEDAYAYAKQSPYPDTSSVNEHIFATS